MYFLYFRISCRRLGVAIQSLKNTHCQQVLRAKHLLTSAPTKTPKAHVPGFPAAADLPTLA